MTESKNPPQASSHPKHDCIDFRTTIYSVTSEYWLEKCGICDKVTKFQWRSKWKRIKSLFH